MFGEIKSRIKDKYIIMKVWCIMQKNFSVTGMTCSACSARVQKSVEKLDGVESANVNLLKNSMSVVFDEAKLNTDSIISAVVSAGYGAAVVGEKSKSDTDGKKAASDELKQMKTRLIVSACFAVPLFYLSMGHMMNWPLPNFFLGAENAMTLVFTQFLLVLPIIFINFKYYRVGYKSLFRRSPNMDSLIALGSSAAVVYGIYAIYKIGIALGHGDLATAHSFMMDVYFESAGVILTLITLGKFFEARAKGKTSGAIEKLMDLSPKTATLIRDGKELTVSVDDVAVGDILIVKSGERIPVDGEVTDGSCFVDEAAITGESVPNEKSVGDRVTGATTLKSGYIKMRALRVGDETTLSQIVKLVDEATSSKAPIARLADKVSGIFVPVVMSIALIATVVWLLLGKGLEFSLSIGICVLVISCPCALGLATPTAIMVGTGKGAENGILIKSAESLETAHKIQTVVFDKTGTITSGTPAVTDIFKCHCESESELIISAASIEKLSEHPLGEAIVKKAESMNLTLLEATDFSQAVGRGVQGKIGQNIIFGGNEKLMRELGISDEKAFDFGEKAAKDGKTPLYFARDNSLLGVICVADTIKPSSKEAIAALREMKIETVMLTGDNEKTANAVKEQVGIDKVYAEALPQDKEKLIRELQQQGKVVAMVGDGINDAPALMRADVGIAIGAGTDVAVESADIVLMKSDVSDVVSAIKLSRAVIGNIKQNLFWAFFYNAIGIPVAAGVFFIPFGLKLNPMLGAFAMSFSSVFVVSNALRLRFLKLNKSEKAAVTAEKNIETEAKTMTKVLTINSMMCMHCVKHVEDALKAVDGVTDVKVELEAKTATVTAESNVGEDALINAVKAAGYEVDEIK